MKIEEAIALGDLTVSFSKLSLMKDEQSDKDRESLTNYIDVLETLVTYCKEALHKEKINGGHIEKLLDKNNNLN